MFTFKVKEYRNYLILQIIEDSGKTRLVTGYKTEEKELYISLFVILDVTLSEDNKSYEYIYFWDQVLLFTRKEIISILKEQLILI